MLDYDRGPDADWRRVAEDRIDRYRKADLTVRVHDRAGRPISDATVELTQRDHGFPFGSAVDARTLMADGDDGERYRDVVAEQFDHATFENDLKWEPWEAARADPERMQTLQDAADWLTARGIEIRGHYVHWGVLFGGNLPAGLGEDYDGDEAALRERWLANIESRVPAAAELAPIPRWDVINHPVGWRSDQRTTEDVLGTEFYATVVERARELLPEAELWINEGGVLSGREQEDAYERVITDLIDRSASPDGIGFMGHFGDETIVPPDELHAVLDRFADVIPNLQVTEFDVAIEDEEDRVAYFRDVLRTAFSHPAMSGIVLWGFWAGRHWRPESALYDESWELTPIGEAWQELLFEEWHTEGTGRTDDAGEYTVRGFTGTYDLRIGHGGTTVDRSVRLPGNGSTVEIEV